LQGGGRTSFGDDRGGRKMEKKEKKEKKMKKNKSKIKDEKEEETASKNGVDHVVLLKLKPDVTEVEIQALKDGVASLVEIDGVDSATVGSVFVEDWMSDRRGDTSINYGIRISLESKDALKTYQTNPVHLAVIKENIAPLLDTTKDAPVLAYDWESPETK
jgi:hypothetical protein